MALGKIKKQISSLYSDPLKWSVCKSLGLFLIGVYLARDLKGISLDSVPSWFCVDIIHKIYSFICLNMNKFWDISHHFGKAFHCILQRRKMYLISANIVLSPYFASLDPLAWIIMLIFSLQSIILNSSPPY